MPLLTDPSGRPLPNQTPGARQNTPATSPQETARGLRRNASGQLVNAQGVPVNPDGSPAASTAQAAPQEHYDPAANPPGVQGAGPTMPGAPGTRNAGPATGPAPASQAPGQPPQRTYDAKGHASDGSQSIGDDNPWKIGAFAGGTFDMATMRKWDEAAHAGDPAAAQLLKDVGYHGQGVAAWAAERKLDEYVPDARSPWAHDPGYTRQGGTDKAPQFGYSDTGGGYGSEKNALDSYGWWDDTKGFAPKTGPRTDPRTDPRLWGGPQGAPSSPPGATAPPAPPASAGDPAARAAVAPGDTSRRDTPATPPGDTYTGRPQDNYPSDQGPAQTGGGGTQEFRYTGGRALDGPQNPATSGSPYGDMPNWSDPPRGQAPLDIARHGAGDVGAWMGGPEQQDLPRGGGLPDPIVGGDGRDWQSKWRPQW